MIRLIETEQSEEYTTGLCWVVTNGCVMSSGNPFPAYYTLAQACPGLKARAAILPMMWIMYGLM